MNVDVFVLCDAATEQQGKLNILGIFDTLVVRQLPFVLPHCAVAVRVRFTRIEQGAHRVRIHLMDEDGGLVVQPIEGGVQVAFREGDTTATVNMVLNFQGLRFERPGEFALELAVDGRQEASFPLYVRQTPESSDAPPPAPPG